MKNIDLNIKRMLSLLESKMGDVKPLINEQFIPTSFLPKQDWILKKEPEDWLKWIITSGCITNIPGATGSKIGGITTTATENLPETKSNEPLIKVTNFKRINNIGKEIPTNLYILGKKSREGKEGYFKLFLRTQGDESPYLEGQLNCSVQYKDETTSIASGVRGVNTEENVDIILKGLGFTRQLEPGDTTQQENGTTVKKLCVDFPDWCPGNGLLKQYADGLQGNTPIYTMTDQQMDNAVKYGYVKDVDRVKEKQNRFNLKRGIKKINKENFTNQSCNTALITMEACSKNPTLCDKYVKTNSRLQNVGGGNAMGPNAGKLWLSKHIKLCRNNNMYNKKQLADVNDLKIDGVNAGIQLEQTIGKNIRESLKELNLINKIG
jgi:hypothetical protein